MNFICKDNSFDVIIILRLHVIFIHFLSEQNLIMIKQAGQSSGDRALLVVVLSRKSEIEKEQQSLTLVMLSVISAVSSC